MADCEVNTTGTTTNWIYESNTGTTTTASCTACVHRLPCGYCTILHCACPMQIHRIEPTWYDQIKWTCNTEAKDG